MATWIKTGFWEKAQKGFKGWLNLDQLIESIAVSQVNSTTTLEDGTTVDLSSYNETLTTSAATTVDETEYYIPSGIAYTGIYRDTNGSPSVMWNPFVQNVDPIVPTTTYNNVHNQADFNQWYSFAKARNLPFFLNIPIQSDGVIAGDYYSRVLSSNLIAS